jgi:predicted amidohydrolase
MMRRASAEQWKDQHHRIRARRARESGLWVVFADVTGRRGDERIAYGLTSVISPNGAVESQVPLMTVGMVTVDIGAAGCST